MTFGEKLRKARVQCGMTQEDLAKKLKVTNTTISNWEKNNHRPDLDDLAIICGILNVNVSYFIPARIPEDEISITELNMVKRYRKLDAYGRETVDIAISRETERVNSIKRRDEHIMALTQALNSKAPVMRVYTYLRRIACAGSGYYFDDIPTETIEAPYKEGADFIIGVSGDSMEPDYHHGDDLYVKKTNHLEYGDVGIFTIGNECYIKEFGEDGLISRNSNYKNIPANEDIRLIGEVIGKVPAAD